MKCSKCKSLRNQICRIYNYEFVDDGSEALYFDVDKALAIIKEKKLKPKKLKKIELVNILTNCPMEVVDAHLKHIKNVPIIIGQTEIRIFCMDGRHRSLKAFLDKKLPMAYFLSEFDTGRCLVATPKGRVYEER